MKIPQIFFREGTLRCTLGEKAIPQFGCRDLTYESGKVQTTNSLSAKHDLAAVPKLNAATIFVGGSSILK